MGLDMYLYGSETKFNLHDYNIGQVKVLIEVGYWRKANQIHLWFVNEIQGGVDNCGMYYVNREDLEKLKEICETVLKEPKRAEELLPCSEGFFFGSQEYDEWYFNDLQDTIEICNWCLSKDYKYFYYQSSW